MRYLIICEYKNQDETSLEITYEGNDIQKISSLIFKGDQTDVLDNISIEDSSTGFAISVNTIDEIVPSLP